METDKEPPTSLVEENKVQLEINRAGERRTEFPRGTSLTRAKLRPPN